MVWEQIKLYSAVIMIEIYQRYIVTKLMLRTIQYLDLKIVPVFGIYQIMKKQKEEEEIKEERDDTSHNRKRSLKFGTSLPLYYLTIRTKLSISI
jgi:hypothetical protein